MKPKFVNVNGIRTRYFEAGKGEPLVLVHGGQYGMYYNAYVWSRNFALAKRFHLYAFDKLGMGYTDNPKRDKDYTIGATLAHAHDFMTTMGLERVNLLGHSRGAFLVARLALEYPRMVKNLIIVDSNTLAPDDPSTPKDFYLNLEKRAPAVETMKSVQREPIANSYSKKHITNDFVKELYGIAKLRKTVQARQKMKTLADKLFLPDLDRKREETIRMIKAGHLKIPTLILWGLNDPSAPINLAFNLLQIISSKVPRTQLHIFNQAGHYVFREHPDDFNEVIRMFIH